MREVGECAAQPASARRSAIINNENVLRADASICNVQRNHAATMRRLVLWFNAVVRTNCKLQ